MDLSSGNVKKVQNAAVFNQVKEPQKSQKPIQSEPKGLVNMAAVFRKCLQELEEDISSFSSKFSSPSKVEPVSAKSGALELKVVFAV